VFLLKKVKKCQTLIDDGFNITKFTLHNGKFSGLKSVKNEKNFLYIFFLRNATIYNIIFSISIKKF
jgi:hypothetical protein